MKKGEMLNTVLVIATNGYASQFDKARNPRGYEGYETDPVLRGFDIIKVIEI